MFSKWQQRKKIKLSTLQYSVFSTVLQKIPSTVTHQSANNEKITTAVILLSIKTDSDLVLQEFAP